MTKRNTDLLSNRDMFVKYANVVEVARNAKIEIKHYGGTNCVSYHGIFDNKHKFKILSAIRPMKKGKIFQDKSDPTIALQKQRLMLISLIPNLHFCIS